MRKLFIIGCCVLSVTFAWASEQTYAAKGLVLKLDVPQKTLTVSCQAIAGFMPAMTMPLTVRDAKELDGLSPGTTISFTLVVSKDADGDADKDASWAEAIHVESYQGLEVDPLTARRWKLMNRAANPAAPDHQMLALGAHVPDFALLDQDQHRIRLTRFSGKVVALNFIYTRCALPEFCFRTSNNFGLLQKRFKDRLGKDLILLTVTFDPAHDQPDVLRKYASIWKADSHNWHFLTGSLADVQQVCDWFGVDAFPDEGLMTHSLHTAVIDRTGKLAANIEGNQFSSDQLGDLIQTVLDRR